MYKPCSCLARVNLPFFLLCRRFATFQILLYLCYHFILWPEHFYARQRCPGRSVAMCAGVDARANRPSGREQAGAWMWTWSGSCRTGLVVSVFSQISLFPIDVSSNLKVLASDRIITRKWGEHLLIYRYRSLDYREPRFLQTVVNNWMKLSIEAEKNEVITLFLQVSTIRTLTSQKHFMPVPETYDR